MTLQMIHRKQTTEEWLKEAIADQEKGGDCYAVAVVHYSSGQPNEVDRVAIPTAMSLRELAQRFDSRLREHIRDMPGLQSVAFLGFYGGNPEPGCRKPFTQNGALEYPGMQTEPPTKDGQTSQAMRLLEVMTQTFVQGQHGIISGYKELSQTIMQNTRMIADENARLRQENSEAWVLARDVGMAMQDKQYDRDIALKKEERNQALLEKLLQWGPALVNTIAQKKVFPQAVEDTAIVEGLLGEIQPEHLQLLSPMIPPAVMGLVAARAKQIFESRAAKTQQLGEANRLAATVDGDSELQ